MLQRNATDQPLDVWAAGATVQPGDTIDWPDPLIGFEPVEPEPDPEPSPPKSTRKSAAKTAGEESTS